MDPDRRRLLQVTGTLGSGLLLGAAPLLARAEDENKEAEAGVSAVEDLMREHGILRRVLNLYAEVTARLGGKSAAVDPAALTEAATLFREFGEDYHERQLEEEHVFPEVRKQGAPAAALVGVLETQHRRGREITDYVLEAAGRGIPSADAAPLAEALRALDRMYRAHAAREDTVIFPAWKKGLSPARLDELAELFEDIEHRQFGQDGFDAALERVEAAEQALGLADLAWFTAPAPRRTPTPPPGK